MRYRLAPATEATLGTVLSSRSQGCRPRHSMPANLLLRRLQAQSYALLGMNPTITEILTDGLPLRS